jgi:SAM-dependent methyltransferase
MIFDMVDWGEGKYETTAVELEPVAQAVVEQAVLSAGENVLDLACGTGNAALLAAAQGATVIGVDAAPRLLEVARMRAQTFGVDLELREGDLLALPVDDASVDVVLSVFGVIFAADPARALREIARVLRPGGRVLVSAWIPAGPIDAMLGAMGRIMSRVMNAQPMERFAWSDATTVGRVAAEAGLALEATTPGELAIRATSPEAYVTAGQEHPMALAARHALQDPAVENEVQQAMTEVLRKANEDAAAFLVHSPFVVHELRHLSEAKTARR